MSRVGKKPIQIPENVEVRIDGSMIFIKGPKGPKEGVFLKTPEDIKAEIQDGKIYFSLEVNSGRNVTSSRKKKIKSRWGLARNLILNQIKGVTEGYEKKLEIDGLGYRAEILKDELILHIGFINPVKLKKPPGIELKIEKNIITVSGTDKGLVGNTAAKIRKFRAPDPYKAKGIKYVGEIIKKKAGKKAAGAIAK